MRTSIMILLILIPIKINNCIGISNNNNIIIDFLCPHAKRIMDKLGIDNLDYKTKVINNDKFINYLKESEKRLKKYQDERKNNIL